MEQMYLRLGNGRNDFPELLTFSHRRRSSQLRLNQGWGRVGGGLSTKIPPRLTRSLVRGLETAFQAPRRLTQGSFDCLVCR